MADAAPTITSCEPELQRITVLPLDRASLEAVVTKRVQRVGGLVPGRLSSDSRGDAPFDSSWKQPGAGCTGRSARNRSRASIPSVHLRHAS